MIISHKFKFIFVHIPKTGGCSIEHQLIPKLGTEDLITDTMNYGHIKDLKAKFYKIPHHSTLDEILDKFPETKNYFKWAIVRNPWDRMVSLYHFYQQLTEVGGQLAGGKFANLPPDSLGSFEEWIMLDNKYPNRFLRADTQSNHKWRPQYEWVGGKIDYTGKLESIDNNFLFICNNIGIKHTPLENKNSSNHNYYKTYYNETTKNIIEDKYNIDIRKFNYGFD